MDNLGDYPPLYNPKIHGPYDPAKYYGKADIPFGQVKLGELGDWFARREKTPQAFAGACSRAWWRYNHRWVLPRRAGIAGYCQLLVLSSAFFYFINIDKMFHHRLYKYH